MTPEIEKRIKAVQAGRVPTGYCSVAGTTMPKEWNLIKLGSIFGNRIDINHSDYELLSITADKGVIPRSSIADKDNSSEDKSKYKHICVGDIGYNTMRMWQGVCALSAYDGIVSPAYTILAPSDGICASYFAYLFKMQFMINLFYRNSQGLVDDTRCLKYEWFKNIEIKIPPISEQKKIAEILATQDRVIELKEKLIAEKQSQKKYLTSVLLGDDFKKPFKLNSVTIDKKKWEKVRCEKILFPSGKRNKENLNLEPYAITNEYGFVPQKQAHDDFGYMKNADRSAYIIVSSNSFGYNPARINVGSIGYYDGSEDIIVSSLYEVFKTTDAIDDRFLWHWFKSDVFPKWIDKLQEGSVRQYFYYDKLIRCEINLPTLPEQKSIAEVLSAADEEISLLQKDLEQEKLKKKSLMQLLLTGLVRVA